MSLRVGDQGVGLRLAAGSGGSWNSDHRQQRPRGFGIAMIVAHLSTVGQQQVDALGAIK